MLEKYLGYDQVLLTYKELTLLTISLVIISMFTLLLLVTIILNVILWYLVKKHKQTDKKSRISIHSKFENDLTIGDFGDTKSEEKSDYDAFEITSMSHIDYHTINSTRQFGESQFVANDKKYEIFIKQNEGYIILKLSIVLSETLTMMSLLWEIDLLAGLGYLDVTSFYFIGKYLLWISVVAIVYFRTRNILKNDPIALDKLQKYELIIFGIFSIISLFYWSSVTFFASGIWLASHNQSLDGIQYGSFKISTSFMRSNYDSTWSKDHIPCLTYLTLPENSVNEMFINFHINQASCENNVWNPVLKYCKYSDITDDSKWQLGNVVKSEYKSLPTESESRNIFTSLLQNLDQDEEYAFIVLIENHNDPTTYFFKTINPNKITIVNGGDVGINEESRLMNSHGLSNVDPDLIMIGGDISYDNNFPECYRATDQILIEIPHFKKFSNNHVKLIPMIKSSGNHDFGVNSVNKIQLTQNEYEPLFKHYYPQNTDESGKVPSLLNRNAYFYHLFGDLVLIISLDSGYASDIDGAQKEWLQSVLSTNSDVPIKIVHYHEPIYPTCLYDRNRYTILAEQHWVPLFEQYNVTVVFENHAHRLKRTYPLINGKIAENGISYVGDGAWGALGSNWSYYDIDIIEVDKIVNHVWIVEIEGTDKVQLKAIGVDQQVLDSFTIDLN